MSGAGDTTVSGGLEMVITNPNRYSDVPRDVLTGWLRRLLAGLAPETESFGVRFVGDRKMRELNRVYRGVDRTTDVLSFTGEKTVEGHHLGDVAISVPRARSQAAERGHGTAVEIAHLLLHGVLHCLGYDHERDSGEMELLEKRLRREWIRTEEWEAPS